MKTGLIIGIIIIAVALAGILFYQTTKTSDSIDKEGMMDKSGEVMDNPKGEGEMMDKNGEATPSPTATQSTIQANLLAGTTSPYYEFNPIAYQQALSEKKVILLYFFADWCPICKREQADAALPAFNELQNPNLIGFRIHYNDGKVTAEERDLAKQYGITYQHTKIILKDLSSWNKEKYLAELGKF